MGASASSASSTSCRSRCGPARSVLARLGPTIVWEQSYVSGDRIHCVYTSPSPELIREHARQGGFPADRISEVGSVISPATANEPEPSLPG